jgi:tripartite-type tricarboxylate transporter receptor subunit TctC
MKSKHIFSFVRQWLKGAICIMVFASTPVLAQNFPNKPIKLVVPFAVGGGTDILAREIAPGLSQAIGQTVIVDNRGGAGGNIGSDFVAKAAADGYTLLFGSNSLSINAALQDNLPFDPVRSFDPIGVVATAPLVLVINPAVHASNVQELIALAKSKPNTLNWSAPGSGTPHHLASEMFNKMADVKIAHVQYKGGGPAITDLLGGHTQVAILTYASVKSYIASGNLRVLGVTTKQRSALLPDVLTIAEAGVPGYEADLWYGIFAPAATPESISRILNAALNKELSNTKNKQQFMSQGYELRPGTEEDLRLLLAADLARSSMIVKDANLKTDK